MELRRDVLTGAEVAVSPTRQDRPNRPTDGCPFCVGGLEAPEPYQVKAFPNRWPSLPDERCEIVLYTPEHHARFWSLSRGHATAVVDLWAERTTALGGRDDIGYVLIGENRDATVGATIEHPHGQIFAYLDVPPVPLGELTRVRDAGGRCPLCEPPPAGQEVAARGDWQAWVPLASPHPFSVLLAPGQHVGGLPALDDAGRRDLAALLAEVLGRLDHLWSTPGGEPPPPMPSMLWIHQRPTDGGPWPEAHLHVEIAVPMRAPGVQRYVAAMELGSGVYVNPVLPEDAAAALRAVEIQW